MSAYRLFVPAQAVGASLVYFDLFNASGSCAELEVLTVLPVVYGSTAVSGLVAVDLYLTRTSSIGTGGTAATSEGTSLSAATFTSLNNSQTLNASVTARLTPGGGATAGAVVASRSVSTEETNAGSYIQALDLIRAGYDSNPALIVRQGTGIRVIQGSVASVGSIGFEVTFRFSSR